MSKIVILTLLALAPFLAHADVRPARCVSTGAGACTEWQVYTSDGDAWTDPHAYLSWSAQQWAEGLASCKSASGTSISNGVWPWSSSTNVSGGLCGAVFALNNLCQSQAAGAATLRQCALWGLLDGSSMDKFVLGVAKDTFKKLSSGLPSTATGWASVFVEVGFKTFTKQYAKAKVGPDCAQNMAGVMTSFAPPTGGMNTLYATVDSAQMLGQALTSAWVASNAMMASQCSGMSLASDPELLHQIYGDKDLERCTARAGTEQAAISMANAMLQDYAKTYGCSRP